MFSRDIDQRPARRLHLSARPGARQLPHRIKMTEFLGSQTHSNLCAAFVSDSIVATLHTWFAQQADIDGRPEEASAFRSTAATGTSNAHGHLEFLADVGDPVSGLPIGDTDDNIAAALAARSGESAQAFSELSATARREGFDSIADWFDTLAGARKQLAGREVVEQ